MFVHVVIGAESGSSVRGLAQYAGRQPGVGGADPLAAQHVAQQADAPHLRVHLQAHLEHVQRVQQH